MNDEACPDFASIDAALKHWRQGDVVLHQSEFFHIGRLAQDTPDGKMKAGSLAPIRSEVEGWVILSQTCDIVQTSRKRFFVEAAPLVELEPNDLEEVRRKKRAAYALVPNLADRNLVADLDRVMTIEKEVLASLQREPGCTTPQHELAFAEAIARKRSRFAFPDDFVEAMDALRNHWLKIHDNGTDEWHHLGSLGEIRAVANPGWNELDKNAEVELWLIREKELENENWPKHTDAWAAMFRPTGVFKTKPTVLPYWLEDLTAEEYLKSSRLDFDRLSVSRKKPKSN